ncbi:MAG: c-type cytochrome [Syntrophotaleaceae bacterium]
MKERPLCIFLMCLLIALLTGGSFVWAEQATDKSGKALFAQHCALCHPNGGNIINPAKTLDKETLAANGIDDVDGIIDTLRNPGPGMTPFGPELIPDGEARKIADYILETF